MLKSEKDKQKENKIKQEKQLEAELIRIRAKEKNERKDHILQAGISLIKYTFKFSMQENDICFIKCGICYY